MAVLVLCQRKDGIVSFQQTDIETIEEDIKHALGEMPEKIEYLTDGFGKLGDVMDYPFVLGNHPDFLSFLQGHTEYYSHIVIGGCPHFMFTDMQNIEYLSRLLKRGGKIIFNKSDSNPFKGWISITKPFFEEYFTTFSENPKLIMIKREEPSTPVLEYEEEITCECEIDGHEKKLLIDSIKLFKKIRNGINTMDIIQIITGIMKSPDQTRDFYRYRDEPKPHQTLTPLCLNEYPKILEILEKRWDIIGGRKVAQMVNEFIPDEEMRCLQKRGDLAAIQLPIFIRFVFKKEIHKASTLKTGDMDGHGEQFLFLYHTSVEYFPDFASELVRAMDAFLADKNVYHAIYVYWIWVNWSPYIRGSASSGKVLLNSLLLFLGIYLEETDEYLRHADWVALFSPTIESFIDYANEHNVFKNTYSEMCQHLRKHL